MSDDPDLQPIGGVTLADFVAVSLDLGRVQFDSTRAAEIAATHGIDVGAWNHAADGWSERLRSNPLVAAEFNRIYRQR